MNLLNNLPEYTAEKIIEVCKKLWGTSHVPKEFKYCKDLKYFAVRLHFGHVGLTKSYLRIRYMRGQNLLEVMKHAKNMPRAKKHKNDVINEIKPISYKEYLIGKLEELQDPYLRLDSTKGTKFNIKQNLCWVK
jgi:hypothetical protein